MRLDRRYRVIPDSGLELLAASYHGHRFVPHAHDYAVLAITESGEAAGLEGDQGDQGDRLGPGAVLLIPPRVIHAARSVGSSPWQYRAFYLSAERFYSAAGARAQGQDQMATVVHHSPRLAKRLRELHRDLEAGTDGCITSALDATLPELEPLFDRAFRGRAARSPDGAAQRARSLIDRTPLHRWSLGSISQAVGVSPFHLCHSFHREVGTSPYAYALQRRVSVARERLAAPGTISQVAHELGFADQSHLTRLFLRVFGVSPGEYRAAVVGAR